MDPYTCPAAEAASCLFGKLYSELSAEQQCTQLVMSVLASREMLASDPRATLCCAAMSLSKDIFSMC